MSFDDKRIWHVVLMVCSILHLIEAPPTVSISQSSYTVPTGVSVTLACTVTPYASYAPIIIVYWEKRVGNSTLTITSTTNPDKYSGSTTTTPSLTILSTALSDSGSYQCFAVDLFFTAQSTYTTLNVLTSETTTPNLSTMETIFLATLSTTTTTAHSKTSNSNVTTLSTNIKETQTTQKSVTAPGTVTLSQSSYTVPTGVSVTLECTVTPPASYAPFIIVYWEKRVNNSTLTITSTTNPDKYIGSTTTTPSLTILSTALSDSGSYQCFTVDLFFTAQSISTTLHVLTSETTKPNLSTKETIFTTLQSTTTTTTHLKKSNSNVTTLSTNGEETNKSDMSTTPQLSTEKTIFTTTQSTTTTVTHLKTSNPNVYTLSTNGEETNTAENSVTDPSQVTVHAKSIVTASQSESISLECDVAVNSTITSVFWTKTINGTTFDITANREGGTINSKRLVLHGIKWTDDGIYTCHVGTTFGNMTGKPIALLVVTDSPLCPCTVDYLQKLLLWQSQILSNTTREEMKIILKPVLNELRKILSIDRKNLSSFYLSLNSATNKLESEKNIGYVGTTILVIVFGSLVLIDLAGRFFCYNL